MGDRAEPPKQASNGPSRRPPQVARRGRSSCA
jgi:hypothetical protein